MNRNTESHFSQTPSLNIQRSGFDLSHDIKTTMDASYLIPVTALEVLPGDTWQMDMSAIVRMTTPIFPVMDNSYLDYYAFFVPNRLVWEHWEEFNGENKLTAWEQPTEYNVPMIEAPEGGWTEGTIADYYGVPTKIDNIEVSALPFRGYSLIWNDWFRDENRKDPIMIHLDETTRTGVNTGVDYVNEVELGGKPAHVRKFADIFTNSSIEPQKGPDVFIPLGGATGMAPVVTGAAREYTDTQAALSMALVSNNGYPSSPRAMAYGHANGGNVFGSGSVSVSSYPEVYPNNLYANLGDASEGTQTNSTINQLRQAFAIQSFYERLNTAGSRYIEIVRGMFGVSSPDARQQRPEYIGGERVPVNITAVLQTSSTDDTSPQGNVAANSLTSFFHHSIGTYSATEHGYIHILACIRTDHTYQQGIDRHWSRKTRFDYYWPLLANIGDTAILNERIYAQGTDVLNDEGNPVDKEVFGYNEAWREYKYLPSRVTGLMRSNATGSLDSWHYADYYNSLPIGVSSGWIDETTSNIQRTLAVQDEPQFLAHFAMGIEAYRPMPVYNVPFRMTM